MRSYVEGDSCDSIMAAAFRRHIALYGNRATSDSSAQNNNMSLKSEARSASIIPNLEIESASCISDLMRTSKGSSSALYCMCVVETKTGRTMWPVNEPQTTSETLDQFAATIASNRTAQSR